MKLGPITKLDKGSKQCQKNFDDDVMLANCGVIVIFPIYSQFGAIQKPDSGCIVCKIYILIKDNFYRTKSENSTKKSPPRLVLNTLTLLTLIVQIYRIKSIDLWWKSSDLLN